MGRSTKWNQKRRKELKEAGQKIKEKSMKKKNAFIREQAIFRMFMRAAANSKSYERYRILVSAANKYCEKSWNCLKEI